MLDALRQDLRYALRTLGRAPGFAAIAVGSTALGIGACSLIVALLTFILFPRLPIDDAARLLSISERNVRTEETGNQLSYPDLRDLRRVQALAGVAGIDALVTASIGAASRGDPQRHWGAIVTANYFDIVRPRFVLGRGFDADRDDQPGQTPTVVLSHRIWTTRFQSDPQIVGRTLMVNGRAATVVGVTAEGFRGTELAIVSDFWIPFSMGEASENRHRHWLDSVTRLRPDVDIQRARAELDVLAQAMNAADPEGDKARRFQIEPAGRLTPAVRGQALALMAVLLGATALILLAACANVANLLLGRGATRRREIAARLALGASRGRVVRQLLTESLLLALVGGAGGWIMATVGATLFGRVRIPLAWPIDLTIAPDARVLLFSIALAMVTGLIFGLAPALRATRLDLATDLKGSSGDGVGARFGLRNGLVVLQVAICTVLVLCTGLLLRSQRAAQGIDLGIGQRNLLLLAFDPSLERRPDAQARQLLRDILERARAVPGVESATLTTGVPLTLIIDNSRFVPASQEANSKAPRVRTDIYTVAPHFFETMGIPFLEGRDFDDRSSTSEGIAIVNDAFARAAFPGQSPIGQRFVGDGKRLRIMGVVGTTKSRTIGEAPRPSIYLPVLTDYVGGHGVAGVTLVAKTREAALAYAGLLRDAIRQADPLLAVYDVRTMERHLESAYLVPRLASLLSSAAGGVGLAIASIGVYGVISFAVARRRREIGIRLAIGARPGEILSMLLKQGLALALPGVALGVVAGWSVTRLLANVLYGIDPRDTATFVVVAVLLVAIALLACLLPARAAARTDPVAVLRRE